MWVLPKQGPRRVQTGDKPNLCNFPQSGTITHNFVRVSHFGEEIIEEKNQRMLFEMVWACTEKTGNSSYMKILSIAIR